MDLMNEWRSAPLQSDYSEIIVDRSKSAGVGDYIVVPDPDDTDKVMTVKIEYFYSTGKVGTKIHTAYIPSKIDDIFIHVTTVNGKGHDLNLNGIHPFIKLNRKFGETVFLVEQAVDI